LSAAVYAEQLGWTSNLHQSPEPTAKLLPAIATGVCMCVLVRIL